ncbi:MAG: hypothetical protein JKX85_01330 [Phycisphaeraceae bacterium]|nr:hypothetical protein [Phycisphaeraceae bacterium]
MSTNTKDRIRLVGSLIIGLILGSVGRYYDAHARERNESVQVAIAYEARLTAIETTLPMMAERVNEISVRLQKVHDMLARMETRKER